VSLGGFWPDYSCVRYYWYPAHSYLWYGYYPVAQEVSGETYNYYTYNYYDQPATSANDYSAGTTGIATVDETTFADVREKLARQQASEPAAQTDADTLFDEGVKAFGQGSYAEAEEKFAQALGLDPQDMILPFAYAQAQIAQGKYTQAAEMLRLALSKSSPDKEGVYFPRGLYLNENTLDEQIDRLAEAAGNNPADSDLQLLLGYQWLGIGETEKALVPLNNAARDDRNRAAAIVMLDLAEKIKSGENQ
jgi:tetratricopeptide (TPR) repeat protein